jgi:hypothetical protein
MLWTILVVILILILLGGVGGPYIGAPWSTGYGGGYAPIGVIGIILIILVIWLLFGGGRV